MIPVRVVTHRDRPGGCTGVPRARRRLLLCGLLAVLLAGGWVLGASAQAPPEDVPHLLRQLEDPDPVARRRALAGLAERGDETTVPRVARALRDADPLARELAERALWAIWSRSGDDAVDALLRRGIALLENGREAQSVPVFTQVIERLPDFAEGWNKRATAYYHVGEYQRSLQDIAETLKRNPYHFGALSGAGLCLIELERYGEAQTYFERALDINPNLEGVKALLEQVRVRARRPMA